MRLVAIWAISDPEVLYEAGVANLNDATKTILACTIVGQAVRDSYDNSKKISQKHPENPVLQGAPSFVWINPPPGADDDIILGIN